jgi:rod shape-determining protein MreB and related proteins
VTPPGGRGLAVDLGSSNVRVVRPDVGLVLEEPSVLAVNRRGDVLALGREAEDLIAEGHPNVAPARPVVRGVITEYELAQQLFRTIFRLVGATQRFAKPRVLIAVPSSLTPVERRAVQEAAASAGSKQVSLVEAPLAAAVGAGLPIQDALGSMVVDVGGATTEIAMVALGEVIHSRFVAIGGSDMDEAIARHIRKRWGLAVGERSAEAVKVRLGSAYPAAEARPLEVTGRELTSAMPKTVTVTADEIREVLSDPVRAIVDSTRDCLAESPSELAHDVLETGLFLTGGGGMLRGLDMRLAQECEVPVHLTDDPMRTVALGVGRLVEAMPGGRGARASAHRGR